MPQTFTSATHTPTQIIEHLATAVPYRSASTDVNNVIHMQSTSRRKKTYQFNCDMLKRNETTRQRLVRKLALQKKAKADKRRADALVELEKRRQNRNS